MVKHHGYYSPNIKIDAATIQGWPLIQDSIYSIKQLLSVVTIQYIK